MSNVADSRLRFSAVILIAAVAFSGCTGESNSSESPSTEVTVNFDELVETQLASAEAADADSSQVDALKRAQESGEVSSSDFVSQRYAALDCMAQAGIGVTEIQESEATGLPTVEANIEAGPNMTDDQLIALSDACNERFSLFLQFVYDQQPSALNLWYGRIEEHREPLLACLRDNGAVIADDAPMDELLRTSEQVTIDTMESGAPASCLAESGAIPLE